MALCKDLETAKALSHLYAKYIFDEDDKEAVANRPGSSFERNGLLLDILVKKGPGAFDVFCEVLKEIQPHLRQILMSDQGMFTLRLGIF